MDKFYARLARHIFERDPGIDPAARQLRGSPNAAINI